MKDPRVADGRSHQAFERYVVPEVAMLSRVAHRLEGNVADADDLVQETLVRAFVAIDRFDGRYPRAWLLTILRNTWAKQRNPGRSEVLRDPVDELTEQAMTSVEAQVTPETVVLGAELCRQLEAAFFGLPWKLRRALALIALHDLSYTEAARLLEIPPGTVMSRVHYARASLRRRLAA